MTRTRGTYPHPQAGHGGLPRPMHTAAALGYPASRFSLRDPATLGQKKIAAPRRPAGTLPTLWQIRQAARGISRKGGGMSGCSVTRPTGATGRCGASSIRNARASVATMSTSSVKANGEPTQMRGPAPNGMYAKRGGANAPGMKRDGSNRSGARQKRRCRFRIHGGNHNERARGTGTPPARSSSSAWRTFAGVPPGRAARLTVRRQPAASWPATAAGTAPTQRAGRRRDSRDSAGRRRAGNPPRCTTARPNCRRGPGSRSGR